MPPHTGQRAGDLDWEGAKLECRCQSKLDPVISRDTLKKSRYSRCPAGRIRNCKQWHHEFWVTPCLSCTWCASSLGKIKRNYNYHLKGVTDKGAKTRARTWFSLAVCLSSYCNLQEVMSNASLCHFLSTPQKQTQHSQWNSRLYPFPEKAGQKKSKEKMC